MRGAVCALAVAQQPQGRHSRRAVRGRRRRTVLWLSAARDRVPGGRGAGRTIRGECLDLIHRVSLQRVDHCSMRHQIETRETFLDPSVASAQPRKRGFDARGRRQGGRQADSARDLQSLSGRAAGGDPRPAKVGRRRNGGSCWKLRFNEATSACELLEGRKNSSPSTSKAKNSCSTFASWHTAWTLIACRICATAPGFHFRSDDISRGSKLTRISACNAARRPTLRLALAAAELLRRERRQRDMSAGVTGKTAGALTSACAGGAAA